MAASSFHLLRPKTWGHPWPHSPDPWTNPLASAFPMAPTTPQHCLIMSVISCLASVAAPKWIITSTFVPEKLVPPESEKTFKHLYQIILHPSSPNEQLPIMLRMKYKFLHILWPVRPSMIQPREISAVILFLFWNNFFLPSHSFKSPSQQQLACRPWTC